MGIYAIVPDATSPPRRHARRRRSRGIMLPNDRNARHTSVRPPTPLRGPIRIAISGYRFYSPELGRWINRDPIGEWGGVNVNVFVLNEPVLGFDLLGFEKLSLRFIANDLTWVDRLWEKGAPRYDGALDLLAQITKEVGDTIDPTGKCGNCILHLRLVGHSGVPGCVVFGRKGSLDQYTAGFHSAYPLNESVETLVSAVKGMMCDDGSVYFHQCNVGYGDAGTILLTDLAQLLGVPVSAACGGARAGFHARSVKTVNADGSVEICGDSGQGPFRSKKMY